MLRVCRYEIGTCVPMSRTVESSQAVYDICQPDGDALDITRQNRIGFRCGGQLHDRGREEGRPLENNAAKQESNEIPFAPFRAEHSDRLVEFRIMNQTK